MDIKEFCPIYAKLDKVNVNNFGNINCDVLKIGGDTKIPLDMPGSKAFGLLRVAANVADGETVTIGTDVFEVDIINTDTTVNVSGGDLNNTRDPVSVTIAAHGLVVGALIRVEDEIMKVTSVPSVNKVVVSRARCGTTAAAHADATDIFKSNAHPANLPIGLVTTLTPTVFLDALVAEINANLGAAGQSQAVTAYKLSANEMLIIADAVGAVALATTETLAGANNAWMNSTMIGGAAAGVKKVYRASRVPTANDVTLDYLYVPLDFTPSFVLVTVSVTATGIPKAWVGGVTVEAGPPVRLKITNEGATDWAATDTINILAIE